MTVQAVSTENTDTLSLGWKLGLYLGVLVPFVGPWIVVIASSVAYYHWRAEFPKRAAQVNRHGWLAWILGCFIWVSIYLAGSSPFGALDSRAEVQCLAGGDGFVCTVTHRSGNAPLAVCWNLRITCHNNISPIAHACANVDPGGTASRTIAITEFSNAGGCDAFASVAVDNVQLTAR